MFQFENSSRQALFCLSVFHLYRHWNISICVPCLSIARTKRMGMRPETIIHKWQNPITFIVRCVGLTSIPISSAFSPVVIATWYKWGCHPSMPGMRMIALLLQVHSVPWVNHSRIIIQPLHLYQWANKRTIRQTGDSVHIHPRKDLEIHPAGLRVSRFAICHENIYFFNSSEPNEFIPLLLMMSTHRRVLERYEFKLNVVSGLIVDI